jgi:U1 small nuclear ribonucleoprotein
MQAFEVTEAELRQEFEHYGPIKQVVLIKNRQTGKPRGYAFVEFEHSSDLKGLPQFSFFAWPDVFAWSDVCLSKFFITHQ